MVGMVTCRRGPAAAIFSDQAASASKSHSPNLQGTRWRFNNCRGLSPEKLQIALLPLMVRMCVFINTSWGRAGRWGSPLSHTNLCTNSYNGWTRAWLPAWWKVTLPAGGLVAIRAPLRQLSSTSFLVHSLQTSHQCLLMNTLDNHTIWSTCLLLIPMYLLQTS